MASKGRKQGVGEVGIGFITPYFSLGMINGGQAPLYLVDEHGCPLHTEPIAFVLVAWHPSFASWIEQQQPNYKVPNLLWHPALGESFETYKALAEKEKP